MSLLRTISNRRRERGERGAALVEFALAIPIFLFLLALIFDTGLGFSASRSSSSTARSAARVAALAGEDRYADFRALDAVRAKYGDGANVRQITVYRTSPGGDGEVPTACAISGASQPGLCNVYSGATLSGLSQASFASVNDAEGNPIDCAPGSIDSAWCPTDRRANDGDYLGVAIWTTHDATVGLGAAEFDLEDRAVFALYFEPLPATPTP